MSDKDSFVHVHVHTEKSILDGKSTSASLVEEVARQGATALGVTDHGSMAQIVDLAIQCKKHNINLIPGVEAYHWPDRHSHEQHFDKNNFHLLLLAANNVGYQNLMRLTSLAHESYHYKPRIDNELISQYSKGVISTTGCLGSWVNQALLAGDRKKALQITSDLKDIFEEGHLFMEIQDHGIPEQRKIMADQLWIAKQLDLKLLATNDSHYTHSHEADVHDALLCIGTGKQLADKVRFRFESDQHYVKTPAEMRALFPEADFPGACDNTLLIAEMSDVQIPIDGDYLLPKFPVPEKYENSADMLKREAYEGAVRLYGNDDGVLPKAVTERLDYELGVLNGKGFPDYVLIVADMINYAKSRGIMVGPGRGSVAGSIVAYCMGITNVDPLHWGLFFERFLNPGRPTMPDIDVDFEPNRREEVRMYLSEKYGADRVAHIGTYGTLKAKSAIKDSARIMGYRPIGEELSKMVVSNIPLSLALKTKDQLKSEKITLSADDKRWWNNSGMLRETYQKDLLHREVLDVARSIEGAVRNEGVHACAVLITPTDLTDHVPLRYAKNASMPVTQYTGTEVEAIGGLKLDLLSIDNLTTMRLAMRLAYLDLNKKIDIDRLPLDDPAVYRMLCRSDTDGVFQLGESGMRELMVRMQPTSFNDISALIALYRPGPMGTGMHNDYADRKNGRQNIEAVHPDMLEILSDTYGVIVYQEQVMQLAQHYAGYDATEADNFRKAMGKKKPEAMAAEYEKFTEGVVARGFKAELGQKLWDMIEPFSGYAFNKSHSISYAMISYQNAWLKVHYPAQYAAACIDTTNDARRKAMQVASCRANGISVYAPDINKSKQGATTSTDSIWIGLKGISHCDSASEAIIQERQVNGEFKSLGDFLVRTRGGRVNVTASRNLVLSGAFDSLHSSRKSMSENVSAMIDSATLIANAVQIDEEDNLFGDDIGEVDIATESYDLDGPDYSPEEKSLFEAQTLGFFVGKHPFMAYRDRIEGAVESGVIPSGAVMPGDDSVEDGANVTIYGILTSIQNLKSKAKKPYAKYVIETDHATRIDGIIFGRHLDDRYHMSMVISSGTVKEESFTDSEGDEEVESSVLVLSANSLDILKIDTSKPNLTVIDNNGQSSSSSRRTSRVKAIEEAVEENEKSPVKKIPLPVKKPSSYRFLPKSEDDMIALRQTLVMYGPGSIQAIIRWRGADVSVPGLRCDLNQERVKEIFEQIGVMSEEIYGT